MKAIFLAAIVSVFVLMPTGVFAINPSLTCPAASVDNDYAFQFALNDFTSAKTYLQIGYDDTFVDGTYTQIKAKKSPVSIAKSIKDLAKYVLESPGGKLYARIYAKIKKTGEAYSNACEFTLSSYKVMDASPWLLSTQSISTDYSYSGQKSLKKHINSSEQGGLGTFFPAPILLTLFGSHVPYDLTNAVITAKVRTPNCSSGLTYAKNSLYIHATASDGHTIWSPMLYFTSAEWHTVKLDLSKRKVQKFEFDPASVIFFWIEIHPVSPDNVNANQCDDDAYLDDVVIQKDGKTEIFSFE